MSEEQLTGIEWTTASRERIDLANMDDAHIKNCINYILRNLPGRRAYIPKFKNELILRGVGRLI